MDMNEQQCLQFVIIIIFIILFKIIIINIIILIIIIIIISIIITFRSGLLTTEIFLSGLPNFSPSSDQMWMTLM